jgi:hypothetical protein
MGKCSNYTGHDGAMDAQLAMPLPDEVNTDIEALEAWRKEIVVRLEGRKKPAPIVASSL